MAISDSTRQQLRELFDEHYTEERQPRGGLPLTFEDHLRAFERFQALGLSLDQMGDAFDPEYAKQFYFLLAADKSDLN